MDVRKVVRIRQSHYINIPSDTLKALEIVQGERLEVTHIPGTGFLITPIRGNKKTLANLQNVKTMLKVMDANFALHERKLKEAGLSLIRNFHEHLVSYLAAAGLLGMGARVSKLERSLETPEQRRARMRLVKRSGRTRR